MLNIKPLSQVKRLLFTIPLRPVQGDRFQPTGFPNLGAAVYQTKDGTKLLVESAQSMANRMEMTCWDGPNNKPISALNGISHVTVTRKGEFLTDSMLEAHRINSPYILGGKDRSFLDEIKAELGVLDGPVDRKRLAQVLLKYDIGCLIHGVFIPRKELAGGRLRVARALSSFIEASGVNVAASGGVKNDHVNPLGDTKNGFGNVLFARDEFVAERIDLHINLDLAQIRGYGFDTQIEDMLIFLSLQRVRRLLDGDLRLRTACDLEPVNRKDISASRPDGFKLSSLEELDAVVKTSIADCKAPMKHTTVKFEDELKKGKDNENSADVSGEEMSSDDPIDD